MYGRSYDDKEREFLYTHIPGRTFEETAALFNAWNAKRAKADKRAPSVPIKTSQVKSFSSNHGIGNGRDARFKKGQTPHNKGQRRPEGWKSSSTVFKAGNIPHNHRPVGSTRVTVDGYTEIKVGEPKKWKMLHAARWEREHGRSVPKGHVVLFGDGYRQNFSPDNLILVSRAQLARLNQKNLIGNSADLTRTGVIVAELLNKIGEKKKERKGKRQN